jgi:hypothetical protein
VLGTEDEEGYRTGQPGNIGWRNSFLGIYSGTPYTFKNTGSGGVTDKEKELKINDYSSSGVLYI